MTFLYSLTDRIRLLPSLIVCATLLFLLKVAAITTSVETAFAQEEAGDNEGAVVELATQGQDGDEAPGDASANGPDASEAETAEAEAVDPADFPEAQEAAFATAAAAPSAAELEVLQSLGERRRQLDARQRELDLQERLLQASERRIEARIDELKQIQAEIEDLFGVQEEAQQEQMASLISMYGAMKPKDAAAILSQLDMDVLLRIARGMSERKMAKILAEMDPVAAQELTVELATGGAARADMDLAASLDEAPLPIP